MSSGWNNLRPLLFPRPEPLCRLSWTLCDTFYYFGYLISIYYLHTKVSFIMTFLHIHITYFGHILLHYPLLLFEVYFFYVIFMVLCLNA